VAHLELDVMLRCVVEGVCDWYHGKSMIRIDHEGPGRDQRVRMKEESFLDLNAHFIFVIVNNKFLNERERSFVKELACLCLKNNEGRACTETCTTCQCLCSRDT